MASNTNSTWYKLISKWNNDEKTMVKKKKSPIILCQWFLMGGWQCKKRLIASQTFNHSICTKLGEKQIFQLNSTIFWGKCICHLVEASKIRQLPTRRDCLTCLHPQTKSKCIQIKGKYDQDHVKYGLHWSKSSREPQIYNLYFFLVFELTYTQLFYENKHINDVGLLKYDLFKIISCQITVK